MFRKDYIKKQIDLFFQELVALLSKKVPIFLSIETNE